MDLSFGVKIMTHDQISADRIIDLEARIHRLEETVAILLAREINKDRLEEALSSHTSEIENDTRYSTTGT